MSCKWCQYFVTMVSKNLFGQKIKILSTFYHTIWFNFAIMWFKFVSNNEIIRKFDKQKSTGQDGIGHFIVKRVDNEPTKPLTAIFNLSLLTDQLQIAKFIPIDKRDDDELFSNFRPVSVLPCF